MDLLPTTLAWLLQTATDTRDAFAWLGTAADILALLSAIVAVIAWSRARKAATEAQEAVRGLRLRLGRTDAYAAAVSLGEIVSQLLVAYDSAQWHAVLSYHRQAQHLIATIRGHRRTGVLLEVHVTKLTAATTVFSDDAAIISAALNAGLDPLANLDTERYNRFMADIAATIEEIKVVLRDQI
ncbi:MAG TPA: hypothetical protein VF914_20330 [Chloroflexia bacterium]|jgi:hypothetical protein